MRIPSHTNRRGSEGINMTPMIDCVFLLMVFFICTTGYHLPEFVLPGKLSAVAGSGPADPNVPPPPEKDFPDVVIRITWTGDRPAWQVNGAPMSSLAQVQARLQQIAQIKADAPVILHPDKEVPLGDVIDLYDLSRLVGFQKIQFAASEKI